MTPSQEVDSVQRAAVRLIRSLGLDPLEDRIAHGVSRVDGLLAICVRPQTAEVAAKFPAAFEGYAVDCEVVGPVVAL